MKRFAIGLLATTLAAVALPAAAQTTLSIYTGYGSSYGYGQNYGSRYGYGQNYGSRYGYGQDYGSRYGYGWSRSWGRGGDNFAAEYDHIYAGIQHGLADGSYNRRDARLFFREVQTMRRMERVYRNRSGRIDPWARRDLQQRIERLHQIMHAAHQGGHARDWERDDHHNPYNPYNRRR